MLKGEQCLVTGGTGFIGRFVVRQLLRQGMAVRLLCRDEAKARRLFGNQTGVVSGDLRDPAACGRACRGVYTAIHVGGVCRFGRRQRDELAWRPNRPLEQTMHETVAWFRQRPDLLAASIANLSVRHNVAC